MNGLRNTATAAGCVVCIALVLAAGCSQSAADRPLPEVQKHALDYGWEFACAITNAPIDLSDRCASQEKIALAYLAANDMDKARWCALQIEDWRKGIVLAKIDEWYATHGESAKAEAMLSELDACGLTAKDWQRDWLSVAIARVRALLGREHDVAQTASSLALNSNLGGDAAASLALVLARTGRVDEAETILNSMPTTNNSDFAVSRTQGFLDLATLGELDKSTATQVLMSAWQATDAIRPYRRWEVQLNVIDAMARNGLVVQAGPCLQNVASNVVAAEKLPPDVQVSMLSQAAILWQRLGEPQRSAALLTVAEQAIRTGLETIYQPGAYAKLADAYATDKDAVHAQTFYNRGLDIANGLANRRPRAMAGVDVCVSLAGHDEIADAGIRKRLDDLLATFRATQP